MAKNHGARQQKKLAKQKARRQEKRSDLARRTSTDPTIRLQRAERWPVVQALISKQIWELGIGDLVIARRESEGNLIISVFLVDVYCLGVKNAFWMAGSAGDLKELVSKIEKETPMAPISPECLAKVIWGAVDYADSFGFRPHPDFRHASMLLAGIDPGACTTEFTYGYEGKPFYFQGPHESTEQARAIVERIHPHGGDYIVLMGHRSADEIAATEVESAVYDALEEDTEDD